MDDETPSDDNVIKIEEVKKKRAVNPDKKPAEKIDGREKFSSKVMLRTVTRALEEWRELDGLVYYDSFMARVMRDRAIPGLPDDGEELPAPWCDRDTLGLQHHMSRWLIRLEKGVTHDAVMHVANGRRRSSAMEFFNSLDPWDGVERLDWFLVNVCGIDPEEEQFEYVKKVTRAFFISVLARVFRPGCQVETILILEGDQGVLKSSLLRAMAMKDKWFSNKMPHKLDDTDTKDHLKGKLIIEMSELVQLKGKAVEEMKTFMSICEDEHRSKFARTPSIYKRQCVFTGSTNDKYYLNDDTGNRRYLPIHCGKKRIDLDQAKESLPQVYAEALVAFNAGEPWWFDSNDQMMLVQQSDRLVDDEAWDFPIKNHIKQKMIAAGASGSDWFYVRTNEVLAEACGVERGKQGRAEQMRVAKVLRKIGAKRKNTYMDGVNGSIYIFEVKSII